MHTAKQRKPYKRYAGVAVPVLFGLFSVAWAGPGAGESPPGEQSPF
jgi:hypothetical protein